jgi:hypothetical protein
MPAGYVPVGHKIWFLGIFGHAQSIGSLDQKNPASSGTSLVRFKIKKMAKFIV